MPRRERPGITRELQAADDARRASSATRMRLPGWARDVVEGLAVGGQVGGILAGPAERVVGEEGDDRREVVAAGFAIVAVIVSLRDP